MTKHFQKPLHSQLNAAKKGDRAALEWLVGVLQPFVHRYTLKRVSDPLDAADITQEVSIRLVKNLKTIDGEAHLKPWLIRVARRLIIDHYRKRRAVSLEPTIDIASTENIAEQKALAIDVDRALKRLPRRKAYILRLYYFESQSCAEIARRTRLSMSNVRVELHRAKRELRQYLSGYNHLNPRLS